jgi:hypothetical protein
MTNHEKYIGQFTAALAASHDYPHTADTYANALKSLDAEAVNEIGCYVLDTAEAKGIDTKSEALAFVTERKKHSAKVTTLSDILCERLEWLWVGRVPLGKMTIFAGNPGIGKSLGTLDLVARLSLGKRYPDGSPCPLGDTLLLLGEDDPADTVRPRLEALGADMTKIHIIIDVTVQSVQTIFDAVEQIREKGGDLKLLVIDPLDSFLGGADSYKGAEYREAMGGLIKLAADERFSIISVDHLNKNTGGQASYRIGGTIAKSALARAAWIFAKDERETDSDRRVFLPQKNNLGKDASGLEYEICGEFVDVITKNGNERFETSRIVWGEVITDKIGDILASPMREKEYASPLQDEVLDVLTEAGHAMKTCNIAEKLETTVVSVSKLLKKLEKKGEVQKCAKQYGYWELHTLDGLHTSTVDSTPVQSPQHGQSKTEVCTPTTTTNTAVQSVQSMQPDEPQYEVVEGVKMQVFDSDETGSEIPDGLF